MTNVDYWIKEVCYNSEGTHIERVKLHQGGGENLGPEMDWPRSDVVTAINNGDIVWTMFWDNQNDKWVAGDRVEVIYVRRIAYIRTDGNSKSEDNLGELPTYIC